jgi:hypothetical protein
MDYIVFSALSTPLHSHVMPSILISTGVDLEHAQYVTSGF